MLNAMPGQRRVVHLDVDADFVHQVVLLEKRVDGGHVEVILVLGGFVGLRLDQQGAFEADAMLVFDHELHEAPQLIAFALEIGIEEGLVALAPAPENVVGAVQPVGGVEGLCHLGRRARKYIRVGVGCGSGGVARVSKEVRGAPQQPDARFLHVAFEIVENRGEVGATLGERFALGRYIAVVKAEEGNPELGEEFEGHRHFFPGALHRVAGLHPRALKGSVAEDVVPGPGEGVPVADRGAQVVLHSAAEYDAVAIVKAKGEGVVGFGSLERDGIDGRKEGVGHDHSPWRLA